MQSVVIIDYGSGNLHSAAKAFERASAESNANARILVSSDPSDLKSADRIVLPGVGAYADCKRGLEAVPGLRDVLEQRVRRDAVPFLGICVGMQLLAKSGHEFEVTEGSAGSTAKCARLRLPILPSRSRTWDGTRSRPFAITRFSPASRRGRTGCTPISCIPST